MTAPTATGWATFLAALRSGAWVSWLTTILGIGVTITLLTATQAGALGDVASALFNLLQAIVTAVHTFHAVKVVQLRRLVELKPGPDGVYTAGR